jgi:hypothetical protein
MVNRVPAIWSTKTLRASQVVVIAGAEAEHGEKDA